MPRRLSLLPTLLFALIAGPSRATHVVVPDDVPTVQQAVDGSADTVFVKDGLVPERVVVTRHVTLEPILNCTNYPHCYPLFVSSPTLQSLQLSYDAPHAAWAACTVRGFHVLGEVRAAGGASYVRFEGCRFDSAVTIKHVPNGEASWLRGCTCLGHVLFDAGYPQVVGNTFLGGLELYADGRYDLRDNLIFGPADVGIVLSADSSDGPFTGNTIRNCTEGIRLIAEAIVGPGNLVEDCSGDAIHSLVRYSSGVKVVGNTLRRCGGNGVKLENRMGGAVRHNLIEDMGLDGVRSSADWGLFYADSNVVLRVRGAGIRTDGESFFHGNVVGDCLGGGIICVDSDVSMVGNTSFSNGGTGIEFDQPYAFIEPIARNVSAFNNGPGFAWQSANSVSLACNDWFGNNGGNVVGATPDSTDLSVDPWFCNVAGGDVHLTTGSPLVAAAGCGQIGALGIGCGQNASVPSGGGIAKRVFQANPVPSRGAIQFEIPPSNGAQRVEVFDVTGARRWEASIPANSSRLEWDGRDSNSKAVAPGVYFGRLTRAGAPPEVTRIILSR